MTFLQPPSITPTERDALYAATVADLPHIIGIVLAIRRGEYALARVLRTRYEAELLLLDDLGWAASDARGHVALTMPAPKLAHVLHHLGRTSYGRVVDFLEQPAAHAAPGAFDRVDRDKQVTSVCHALLTQLSRPMRPLAAVTPGEA